MAGVYIAYVVDDLAVDRRSTDWCSFPRCLIAVVNMAFVVDDLAVYGRSEDWCWLHWRRTDDRSWR